MFPYRKTWKVADRVVEFTEPRIMGILNVTEDSFYDGGFYRDEKTCKQQVIKMVNEGADFIDIGAMSSRPGAEELSLDVERSRIVQALQWIDELKMDLILSVDTYRAEVLQSALDHGAHICNDVSAGTLDPSLWKVVAQAGIPYILMHMQGNPRTMQGQPTYGEVTNDILSFFIEKIKKLHGLGIYDIMVDPGFGFGKTLDHNYKLLNELNAFHVTDKPVMVGISRKSMIHRLLQVPPEEVLPGTSALHLAALERGADVLRVHDVAAARQVIAVFEQLKSSEPRF